MQIEVTKLRREYYSEAKALWRRVFKDEKAYIDWFFLEILPQGQGFCILLDQKVAAILFLLDLPYYYHKKSRKGFYMYGVATEEEHRNKGFLKIIFLCRTICHRKKRRIDLLCPF